MAGPGCIDITVRSKSICRPSKCLFAAAQVRELTAIIRNQIPAGRKSILDAYGEIAFQAWRYTFGGCRYEVEHTLLQVRPRHTSTEVAICATTAQHRLRVPGGPHWTCAC